MWFIVFSHIPFLTPAFMESKQSLPKAVHAFTSLWKMQTVLTEDLTAFTTFLGT